MITWSRGDAWTCPKWSTKVTTVAARSSLGFMITF